MKYTYKMRDIDMAVYVPDDEDDLEVTASFSGRRKDYPIQKDDIGKFFKVKKRKIYFKDLKEITIEDIRNKIKNYEAISSHELSQALNREIGNVRLKYEIGPQGLYGIRKISGKRDEYEIFYIGEGEENTKDRFWPISAFNLTFILNERMATLVNEKEQETDFCVYQDGNRG